MSLHAIHVMPLNQPPQVPGLPLQDFDGFAGMAAKRVGRVDTAVCQPQAESGLIGELALDLAQDMGDAIGMQVVTVHAGRVTRGGAGGDWSSGKSVERETNGVL